jgi:DNA-binding transcriptional ArsR family regulator
MLDLLAARPRTTGELALKFPKLSRFAVMKHLGVLERAGLIVVTRDGRKRWNSINAVPLVEVLSRWVGKYQQAWAGVLLDVREAAESSQQAAESKIEQPLPGSGKGDQS